MKKVYLKNLFVFIDYEDGRKVRIPSGDSRYEPLSESVVIHDKETQQSYNIPLVDLADGSGTPITNIQDAENYLTQFVGFNTGGVVGNGGETILNNSNGWAFYKDDQYTSTSFLLVPQGESRFITINSAVVDNEFLPIGYTDFWDNTNNIVKSKNNGDTFHFSLRFNCRNSVNQGGFSYDLLIGENHDIPIIFKSIQLLRNSGEENGQTLQEVPFHRELFRQFGGKFRINAIRGNLEIYNIALKIDLIKRADINTVYNLVTGINPPEDNDGKPDGTIYLEI